MPSKRRSSSRLRSSAVKKIQKRFRGKQTRKHVTKLRASRKIQTRYRGFKTRKVMKRVKSNMLVDNDCSICLEPLTENVATALPCGHRFHKDCIVNWLTRSQGKCPNCKKRITNINEYAHLANPTMTYEQALVARNQALEERRLATQSLTNAAWNTTNYEESNRSRRLRGINSPTYIRLLQVEEDAGEELRRARERVTNSMRIIRSLDN